MAAVYVRTCRFISLLNLFYILQFYMVWQPKGLCYPILTKFNAKTSFIKNNQELKFPRRPISVWYKHGPTCLVLPKDLTVHMDVELNPGPLQKKPIYLLTCLPTVSGLVSYPANKLLSTNNADTRQVGICGSYYSDSFIDFLTGLVLRHYHRSTGDATLAVESEKGKLEIFTELNPWFLIHALAEEAIICIKDPFHITSASLHL